MSIISVTQASKKFNIGTSSIYRMINEGVLTRNSIKSKIGISSQELSDYICKDIGDTPIAINQAEKILGLSYSSITNRITKHNIPTYSVMGKTSKMVPAIKISEFNEAIGRKDVQNVTATKPQVVETKDKKYVVIVTDNIEEIKALFV